MLTSTDALADEFIQSRTLYTTVPTGGYLGPISRDPAEPIYW